MKITRLKGGSLSGTYLCIPDTGEPFVRKEVSLIGNREYGFQRWYSQLKRLQRYDDLFPGVFPQLIDYGRNSNFAYFDIEYIAETKTIYDFLAETSERNIIDEMFARLANVMHQMHKTKLSSFKASANLYIYEEIERRIEACMNSKQFRDFTSYPEIVFNGKKVPGLIHVLSEYRKLFNYYFNNPTETYTHGNLTLENILYQPLTGRIIFIDPYEENIIDSALAEYSQVLQSSNSYYEIYNTGTSVIEGNEISQQIDVPCGLVYFNEIFMSFLDCTLSADQVKIVRLLEVSQFARMLPFKMEIDENKMLLFYGLGSYLFHELRTEWEQ